MSSNSFKVKNSLQISPSTGAGSEAGDLRVDSTDGNKLKFHNGTSEEQLITADQADHLEYDNTGTNVSASTVQDAITELDSDLNAHVTDSAGAHAASAISSTPSGNLAAATVQAALDELQSDVDTRALDSDLTAHVSDTADAHDASAISNTASGNLAATDVQTALNELQGDIDAINTLADGKIYVGNASNAATEVTPAGDVTIANDGTTAISAGAIVDADINAAAAITRSKIANGTASHVVVNAGDGSLSSEAQLAISRGGTGQASANAALNALLPTQTGNATRFLQTDGTDTTWASPAGANLAVSTVTTTHSASAGDDIYFVDATSGAFTSTLPTAVGNDGKVLTYIKIGTDFNVVTVDGDGSETIAGKLARKLVIPGSTLSVISDGTNWQIHSRSIPQAPTTYTPTFDAALGTVTNINFRWWSDGGTGIHIHGIAQTGTTTAAATAKVSLPNSWTCLSLPQNFPVGTFIKNQTSTDHGGIMITPSSSASNNLLMSHGGAIGAANVNAMAAAASSSALPSNTVFLIQVHLQITELEET